MTTANPTYPGGHATNQLITIAPAPRQISDITVTHLPIEEAAPMRFNCQSCVRKKVKCDRKIPECSGCRKAKLTCLYRAPPPRKRKRKRVEDVHDRLARYERILKDHGLLAEPAQPPPVNSGVESTTAEYSPSPSPNDRGPLKLGKLVSGHGKSRYIDSILLLPAGEGNMCEVSESDEEYCSGDEGPPRRNHDEPLALAMLTGEAVARAMTGSYQSLTELHPSYSNALRLWDVYVQNVEALCKVLHIPTTARIVEEVCKQPSKASKSDECLLFSIYYFAAFSMSDADCLTTVGKPRSNLMETYASAVLQALVNTSWLKTTSLRVLQAYVLFLIAVRSQIDPDTFWSLTGIAVRLAQRMGLHRDGESLGLPPFDVQMRRRLFWRLLPLDSYAGQVSGTGIMLSPDSWDTKPPLNINDDQIYPGMTKQPTVQSGATEMIFCLAKIELSDFYNRTGVKMKGASTDPRSRAEVEKRIDEVEALIESKYLRYCDILNPLHLLTLGVVRSAANVVRLRNRMTPLVEQTISDPDRRSLCTLAQKVLDTDSTIYKNPSLTKFKWQIRSFFLWDAVLCTLFSISKVGFFSGAELNAAWTLVGTVYSNHEELLQRKRALHIVICDFTMKAWTANPSRESDPEPAFITALRNYRNPMMQSQAKTVNEVMSSQGVAEDLSSIEGLLNFNDSSSLYLDNNFGLNLSDWMLWDQLCRDANIG